MPRKPTEGKSATSPGKQNGQSRDLQDELDDLIEEITVDAYGDEEQLWAFRQAFEDNIAVPCAGSVIGEPVSVIEFDYDGNDRRGLTARCRRDDGSEYVITASDVVLAERSSGGRYVAAYRRWLGLEPFPAEIAPANRSRLHKAKVATLDLGAPIELVVISIKSTALRSRFLGGDRLITLRASGLWKAVPGEIITVKARKQWNYGGHPYLSGEIESTRLDVGALGLVPLRLEDLGLWDPGDHYWGEEGEPIEEWATPIIIWGPRREFEMEQVLPGAGDIDDPFDDPITESIDLKNNGDHVGAHKMLMDLCDADLRCLDAHAHLGNFVFDFRPEDALRHYEVGLRIGELSLGSDFDGLLPWGLIDNRPFLRCLNGYGLCLWRLGRFDEAEQIFDRMLWLNPSDNQGARILIEWVRARRLWEDTEAER